MTTILAQLRVKHYIKNALVFLPLVFSMNLMDLASLAQATLIFVAFCAASSGIYVVNDILDAPKDRLHPRKKLRPIASGAMEPRAGAVLAAVCIVVGFALAGSVNLAAALVLTFYLLINALYSIWLKHIVLVDVFCVMSGFLLRVAAGAVAIGVPLSGWLMLTIMALSLFMAFGKRRGELRLLTKNAGYTRGVLSKYSDAFLDRAMYSMLTLSAAFYALWAIDRETVSRVGTEYLIWTAPLVIAGLLRYAYRVENGLGDGDPTNVLFADKPLLCIIIAYIVAVGVIVYV